MRRNIMTLIKNSTLCVARRNQVAFLGWLPLIAFPAAVILFIPTDVPRWEFMWILAWVVYACCKWLTWSNRNVNNPSVLHHLAYIFVWHGLDADAFLNPKPLPPNQKPVAREWIFAFAKTAFGFIAVFVLFRLMPADWPYIAGWVGMVGIIFALHFGSFHVVSCAFRAAGIDAKPIMNWPVAATSVSQYWGQRWNMAFRDLSHKFLFRPLAPRIGARWALFLVFVFSGLMHELVITIPAGGGYGGPMAFFLIQGIALFVERSRFGKRIGLGKGWRGWLFTFIILVPFGPLLFPPAFVNGIVVPFLQYLMSVVA